MVKQRLQTVYEFLTNKIAVKGLLFEELLDYDKRKILNRRIVGLTMTQNMVITHMNAQT